MMPAPKSIEKVVRIFPSKSTELIAHAQKFAGVRLPITVGSSYAQCGSPMATMFINRIPSSATPRRTSRDEIRSRPRTGVAEDGSVMGRTPQ